MTFLKALLGGSKKLSVVLLGILAVLLRDAVGLDEATVALIIKFLMTYIGGQAVVDAVLAFTGAKTA
jgi:hypothetical protein